ncbi:MAG: glycoside hydrolase family 78 protein [Chitinophagaceae bacterium]|nr:glycoside hydrolase family 78 protein [Chitinophagaceae bacterium]
MCKNLPKIILISSLFLFFLQYIHAQESISPMQCEYIDQPMGVDVQHPRLMWQITAPASAAGQTAYQISVASSKENLQTGKADMWNSGKRNGDDQLVYYEGNPLRSHTKYWWKVEVWLNNGKTISNQSWFETGKMSANDWTAAWITDEYDTAYAPSPMFRKIFNVRKAIAGARCYISGLGYATLSFNGKPLSKNSLDPGFTDYGKRVLYMTYDISSFLKAGNNCIGVQLGNGWFNEQTPTVWNFHQAPWRKRPQVICEIHITYKDGSKEVITTDNTWKTATGPLLFDNIHVGATYDARLEQKGWNTPGFNDASWKSATATQATAPIIESHLMPSATTSDTIRSINVKKINDTCYVFDMGQNFAGVPFLQIRGEKGTQVKLRHAEMIYENGNVDQRNISMHLRPRNAREVIQTDIYILKGEGTETFIPPFTYHGFQYIELTSDRVIPPANVKLQALKMHSDVKEHGHFRSSSKLLNDMYAICKNSYLSNLFGLPTDCPTREKNGWMADGFMVQEAGMINYDSRNIYAKWVKDMVDAQSADGDVPGIVPTSWKWNSEWAGPIWDAAIFIVPSLLYQYSGDKESMKNIYPTAKKYLAFAATIENEKGLLSKGLGDWLYYKAITPVDFMVSCYYYHDNILMAKMANIIGRGDEAKQYEVKAAKIKDSINKYYFDPVQVSYGNKTQLSYALPLYMNIAPEQYRKQLAKNLNDTLAANNYSLDFGFIGSLIVPEVLSEFGYTESVYKMVTKETLPSWGYWIKNFNATTLFETWDISRNIGDASRNHPSMGAVSAWMYKTLAGINTAPGVPAFKKIIIRPAFIGDLDFVDASYASQYGIIKSHWERKGKTITLKVTIPSTSKATIELPGQEAKEVSGGEHVFSFSADNR